MSGTRCAAYQARLDLVVADRAYQRIVDQEAAAILGVRELDQLGAEIADTALVPVIEAAVRNGLIGLVPPDRLARMMGALLSAACREIAAPRNRRRTRIEVGETMNAPCRGFADVNPEPHGVEVRPLGEADVPALIAASAAATGTPTAIRASTTRTGSSFSCGLDDCSASDPATLDGSSDTSAPRSPTRAMPSVTPSRRWSTPHTEVEGSWTRWVGSSSPCSKSAGSWPRGTWPRVRTAYPAPARSIGRGADWRPSRARPSRDAVPRRRASLRPSPDRRRRVLPALRRPRGVRRPPPRALRRRARRALRPAGLNRYPRPGSPVSTLRHDEPATVSPRTTII